MRMIRARAAGRDERGAATAELAMVLPLLVALTLSLVWMLTVATAQLRTVDAAREVARALARGEDESIALARGRHVAPAGSAVSIVRFAGEIRVTVRSELPSPGGLIDHLPAPRLHAVAVAAEEEAS